MPATASPHRVQLKRTKGWKMPADTVKIDRTTRWGNPFTPADSGSVANAVANHAAWMKDELAAPDGAVPPSVEDIRSALGGRHLACWCALDGPCHADLMLQIANGR
ncbi:MAG: DUF4326 domain-containing protein [Pseudomonadota bacterium]